MQLSLALLTSTLVLLPGLAAQIAVQALQPARNRTTTPTATGIEITFAEPVQPATVNPQTLRVYGRWSGVHAGSLTFTAGNRTVAFAPARPFFPGEMVTVMLSDAVTAVSSNRLRGGYTWSFWTLPARGSRNLPLAATIPVRRSGESAIRTYGAYAGDLDGDGAPDLSLPNENTSDVRVLRNDGCGSYAPPIVHALPANSTPSTNEGQDFDGDGHIDLAVGNISGGAVSVLIGDGAGSYRPRVQYQSGSGTRGLCVLDVDGDGDVDIVTANRSSSNLALHLNQGNGTFAPATFFDGGGTSETAIGAADANGDGIADLFVGCYGSSTITLLLGNGAGGFSLSSTVGVQGQPWMIALGDVDGDGHVDAVTCNSSQALVAVARGNGAGGLLPAVHYAVGSFPLAIDLGDVDGDGALDLVASNFSGRSFTLYWNDGSGGFVSPLTLPAPQAGSCAILADDDRDGDLDVLGVDELADVLLLFRQTQSWPSGVQPGACAATLRLDNLARGAGYGSNPPHAAAAGRTLFVGVTGTASQPFGVLGGIERAPGTPLPFGTFNLDPTALVVLPGGVTDAFGEATLPLPLPADLPPGAALALQGAVVDPNQAPGLRFTNPEVARVP